MECNLPKESESRVEQSFNEQLFSRVLGYRTLLSHEALPFHLRPKNFAKLPRRYDDFSLGVFWGDERDVVLGTAEFKDPGCPLDAPQKDRRDRLSPVAQAFRVAGGIATCRWVLVSNFRELRLYALDDASTPLMVIDLHEIRTPRQLALLRTYFDLDALVGGERGGKPRMATVLDSKHISTPIAAAKDCHRLIVTFTTSVELPLTAVYDAVVLSSVRMKKGATRPKTTVQVDDGWCGFTDRNVRVAASTEGQVRVSVLRARESSAAQVNPDARFWELAHDIFDALSIIQWIFHDEPKNKPAGIVTAELREIKGWSLYFQNKDLLHPYDATNYGIAQSEDLFSGDFRWSISEHAARVMADCLAELGIGFVHQDGARLRFNQDFLAEQFRRSPTE